MVMLLFDETPDDEDYPFELQFIRQLESMISTSALRDLIDFAFDVRAPDYGNSIILRLFMCGRYLNMNQCIRDIQRVLDQANLEDTCAVNRNTSMAISMPEFNQYCRMYRYNRTLQIEE